MKRTKWLNNDLEPVPVTLIYSHKVWARVMCADGKHADVRCEHLRDSWQVARRDIIQRLRNRMIVNEQAAADAKQKIERLRALSHPDGVE